ncbi:hypothetical protein ACFLQL_00170 [Verrucomicrobiota bacterium]
MGLINYYKNKYLKKIKNKYGDKAYLEVYQDGRYKVKSEIDDKVLFECNSFKELFANIKG